MKAKFILLLNELTYICIKESYFYLIKALLTGEGKPVDDLDGSLRGSTFIVSGAMGSPFFTFENVHDINMK